MIPPDARSDLVAMPMDAAPRGMRPPAGAEPGPPERRAREAGFTLLEILLALALMALVMLGVWGALASATRVTRSADALMEQGEQVRTVQHFVRRHLAAATPQPWMTSAGAGARVFRGDATSMQYVAPLPMQSGHAGLYLQTLSLEQAGSDGGLVLWLSYQPYTSTRAISGEPVRHRLLANLAGGHFQYLAAAGFDQAGGWRDEWTATNGLPLAVRIQLDPAWPAPVVFPEMLVPVHAGEGTGIQARGRP